jgi:hypothetical protein
MTASDPASQVKMLDELRQLDAFADLYILGCGSGGERLDRILRKLANRAPQAFIDSNPSGVFLGTAKLDRTAFNASPPSGAAVLIASEFLSDMGAEIADRPDIAVFDALPLINRLYPRDLYDSRIADDAIAEALTEADLAAILDAMKINIRPFLVVDRIRELAMTKIMPKIGTDLRLGQAGAGVRDGAVEHNLAGLWDVAVPRSHFLIRPLLSIDRIFNNLADLKVLCIGPRSEGELLNLIGYGFTPGNITAIDLISRSSWVKTGDMHALPFGDGSFDLVFSAFVLPYSSDPPLAAREMARVCRSGGIVAIAANTADLDRLGPGWAGENPMVKLDARSLFASNDDILDLFAPLVGRVFFNGEPSPEYRDCLIAAAVIFEIARPGAPDWPASSTPTPWLCSTPAKPA